MKLYYKHGKLFEYSYALNDNDIFLNIRIHGLTQKMNDVYDHKNKSIRRQCWLDLEKFGHNWLETPIVITTKK
jgi:hypothetical protein